jgi:hypothetical protein
VQWVRLLYPLLSFSSRYPTSESTGDIRGLSSTVRRFRRPPDVGHPFMFIVDSSKAKSQKHAYDIMYDTMVSRIEFTLVTD